MWLLDTFFSCWAVACYCDSVFERSCVDRSGSETFISLTVINLYKLDRGAHLTCG